MNIDIDETNLELTFSVASAEPCYRCEPETGYEYYERLVMTPEAVDLSRLEGGASILRNHDSDHVLGVVVKAYLQGGKLWVRAKFRANDPESVAVFRDAAAGTLPNVSIGYTVGNWVESRHDGRNYRDVTSWQVIEVSVAVGVPADPTVGFYRNFSGGKMKKRDMNETGGPAQEERQAGDPREAENPAEGREAQTPPPEKEGENKEPETKQPDPVPDPEPEPAPEPEPEPKNGEKGEAEGGEEGERNCGSGEEQRNAAPVNASYRSLNVIHNSNNIRRSSSMDQNYSLCRAFQGLFGRECTLERNVSDELYRSAGLTPSNRGMMIRTGEFVAADSGPGAGLVGTDHRGDLFVRSLRKRMGVKGARVIGGLVGNQEIPVQTATVQVGISALNATANKTTPQVGNVVLSPKKFSAYVEVGEDLLAQGNPDAVAFVMDEISAQIARKLDLAILTGSADPAISGVDGTTGVQTVTVADLNSVTWQDILKFSGAIADYEIDPESVAWITRGKFTQAFKGISKDAGSGRFLMEDGVMDGHAVNVCGGLSTDVLYLGVWSNILIGQWGGLEIRLDDVTGLKEGTVTIVGKLLADIAVTNPMAFVKSVKPGSGAGAAA